MTSFDQITDALATQAIELPSWAFGNSGTRFRVFPQAGVPRDPFEKVADAAEVHRLTGLAPSVALHIPWDEVDDFGALRKHAEDLGVALGTINSNTFQDEAYKLGSLASRDAAVRRKAIEKGLIPPEAQLSEEEIDNLIFAPGFSTAKAITSVSGRGVGMDVVRKNVQALGGRIGITSRLGVGSTFSLSLPLTLAVLDGMIVRVGDQTFVIPLSHVVESLRPQNGEVKAIGVNGSLLDVRGTYVPIHRVGELLGIDSAGREPAETVLIVVESDHGQAVLMVDAIVDQRQVVVKSLEANYAAIDGLAGATILGDGRVALILDVDALIGRWRKETRTAQPLELAA